MNQVPETAAAHKLDSGQGETPGGQDRLRPAGRRGHPRSAIRRALARGPELTIVGGPQGRRHARSSWSPPARSPWAAISWACTGGTTCKPRGKPGGGGHRTDPASPTPTRRPSTATSITVAQILLTLEDTEERRRHLNARSTLGTLLKHGHPCRSSTRTIR